MAISGASAHPPQAPIWLDPSGCPPGRVFSFGKGIATSANPKNYGFLRTLLDSRSVFHNKILSHVLLIRCVGPCVRFPPCGLVMTHRNDAARGADVLGRWRMLAEQRLEHLTELFESGRWRRYHSEQTFLENIREAKNAVEIWRGLSAPNAVPPQKPVAAAQSILIRALAPAPVTAPEPIEIPRAKEPEFVTAAAAADPVDMLALEQALDVPELAIDLASIEKRYPLLRNTL
jgi:uncharacterized repeat protein (TIGR03809 family)